MAYNRQMKEKLLDLKATGLSINKIAAELSIAKTTALRWIAQLQSEIETRECLMMEEILERHRLKRVTEIEDIAAQRAKVREAINAHDFGKESLKDLISLDKHLAGRQENLTKDYSADSGYIIRYEGRDGFITSAEEVKLRID